MSKYSFPRLLCKALVLAVGGTLMLSSANVGAIGLLAAYDAALKNDPTFRGAYFDNQAGQEYRKLGIAGLLPQISANYNISRNVTDIDYGPQGIIHPKYLSRVEEIQLRQSVVNFDALARYKQGVAQTKYTNAVFDNARQDLLVRVVGAYTDALFAEEQLALAVSQRDTYVEQRRVNDRLFEKGEGTKTDMLETQSKLDLAEAQVLEAKDNLNNTRASLAAVIGMEVTSVDALAPQFRILPLREGGLDAWKQLALQNNPDLRSQAFAIEAAQQEINKGRAGHTPRVDFVGSYSKNTSDTIDTLNQTSTVRSLGLQVTIPLYSGGSVNATTRQAAAGYEKARADMDAKTDKALVEVRKQYNIVVSSVPRIDALVKAVESSKLLMEATRQSIKGGVRINLDLLNAEQQLYTSQRDLAQARYNYLLGIVHLKAAAGVLGADDLREVASYFQ